MQSINSEHGYCVSANFIELTSECMFSSQNTTQRLPDVIGIGVKKCGTTGIIEFLDYHPLIKTFKDYESFFFRYSSKAQLDNYRLFETQIVLNETNQDIHASMGEGKGGY